MSVVKVEKNSYTVESLYQWDLNQVLTIYGLSLPSIPEIHFTNDAMDRAIVRQASMDSAGVITADVPNSLLQKAGKMKVYVCIYQGDTFTSLYKIEIQVKARNKPGDYTLVDDPEVYSFNALENQVVNALARVNSLSSDAISKYNGAATALTEAKTAYENAKSDVDEAVDNAVDTAMSNVMPTLLSDTTRVKFSKGADAVPDDVFSFLGNYNLHWWRLTGAVTKYKLAETKASTHPTFVRDTSKTIYYSTEINLDENTGELTLVNPIATNGTITPIAGYYYQSKNGGIRWGINTTTETDAIIKFTQVVMWGSDDNNNAVYQTDYTYVYTAEAYTADGETTFATSTDRNAYPDSGTVDEVQYQYLGVPFENAVTAPKIATGSYTGTGTYGASNPNSLTFDFEPKMVWIIDQTTASTPYFWGRSQFAYDSGETHRTNNVTVSGNTMSWYSTSMDGHQFNSYGTEYNYFAIG